MGIQNDSDAEEKYKKNCKSYATKFEGSYAEIVDCNFKTVKDDSKLKLGAVSLHCLKIPVGFLHGRPRST